MPLKLPGKHSLHQCGLLPWGLESHGKEGWQLDSAASPVVVELFSTHLWTETHLRFQNFTPSSLATIGLYDPFCWSLCYVQMFQTFKHLAESPKAEKLLDWPLIWSGLRNLRPLQAPGVRILTCALDSHLNEAGGAQLARTGFRACLLSPNVMLNNNS